MVAAKKPAEKRCKTCGACKECGAAQPQIVPWPYPVATPQPYRPYIAPYPNTYPNSTPPWRPYATWANINQSGLSASGGNYS